MNKNNLDLAVGLRHELHMYPELSSHETLTKLRLIKFLKEHSKLEIIDCGLWFYAVYHSGGDKPAIAFRADFDALLFDEACDIPWKSNNTGIAHKCGHDGHSAALAAFALEVDQKGAEQDVYFLFQHAEETGAGALDCRKFISERGVSEIFAFHNMPGKPYGSVCVHAGVTHPSSMGMNIRFTGRPSHASDPENGINPAFAIAEIVSDIGSLTEPSKWMGMVLATVVNIHVGNVDSNGKPPFGMSPGNGSLGITVRAAFEAEMDRLVCMIKTLANNLADTYGMSVDFEYDDIFPETVAHASSVEKIKRVCGLLKIPVLDLPALGRASEDFGYYTKIIPGAMFLLCTGEGPALHTAEYDFDDTIIERVVDIYSSLAGTPRSDR